MFRRRTNKECNTLHKILFLPFSQYSVKIRHGKSSTVLRAPRVKYAGNSHHHALGHNTNGRVPYASDGNLCTNS